MKRVVLFALVLLSCRHRGEGTNIPEFGTCVVGPDRTSVCAAGLFCNAGYEEREGNTYFKYGTCMRQKTDGDECYASVAGMCAPPTKCVFDVPDNRNQSGRVDFGHCRQQSLSTP
jgi:hypothetical protein